MDKFSEVTHSAESKIRSATDWVGHVASSAYDEATVLAQNKYVQYGAAALAVAGVAAVGSRYMRAAKGMEPAAMKLATELPEAGTLLKNVIPDIHREASVVFPRAEIIPHLPHVNDFRDGGGLFKSAAGLGVNEGAYRSPEYAEYLDKLGSGGSTDAFLASLGKPLSREARAVADTLDKLQPSDVARALATSQKAEVRMPIAKGLEEFMK